MSEKPTGDVVHDAVTGHDEPIEKKPRTSAGLVFLTYPILLIVVIVAAMIYFGVFG